MDNIIMNGDININILDNINLSLLVYVSMLKTQRVKSLINKPMIKQMLLGNISRVSDYDDRVS